ncbi:hypothetical protein FGE05_06275 [Pseudomonas sp. ICMP22404]|uniref:hypothetical protein n=1 Tax=Pseudomonas sp. ICMP22404 TaxID=2583807 RepID=UPI00111A0FDD|nr:hypothetical protein [Pseudomonas sp. ICMP22404]TNF83807.1 hypothetical protein FGE05_06275 [Pseudomonas sp. ICMP22404]
MNDGQIEIVADVLELIQVNQNALAAAIEELALWSKASNSSKAHRNVVTALQTLDQNAEGIASALKLLRQEKLRVDDRFKS